MVDVDDVPVAVLEEHGLSVRIINMLEDAAGLVYMRDLLAMTEADLVALPQFGPKTVESVVRAVERFLGDDETRRTRG